MDSAAEASTAAASLSEDEKAFLVQLARRAIDGAITGGPVPGVGAPRLTPGVQRKAACFVTLYEAGSLRGCMGTVCADEPLYQAVSQCAINSATRDYRFPPVCEEELQHLAVHISVLTPFRRLQHGPVPEILAQLEPGRHGVLIRGGWYSALYLPQVWRDFAGATRPKEAFLTSLSRKAGDGSGTLWRQPDTEFEVFEAIGFGDAHGD